MKYHHADHLSIRVTTDSAGSVVGQRGHYPFGDAQMWYETGGTDKWKFTTYERDDSLNDYAIFRFYVNRLGRFNSPDPIAGTRFHPQSLNRYSYVLNNATYLMDPLGLCPLKAPPKAPDTYAWYCPSGSGNGGAGSGGGLRGNGGLGELGYNMFDALTGAPGSFLYFDPYGGMSWGFDFDLYAATLNVQEQLATFTNIPLVGPGGLGVGASVIVELPQSAFRVTVVDYGVIISIEGLVPRILTLAQEARWLASTALDFRKEYYNTLLKLGVSQSDAAMLAIRSALSDPGYWQKWGGFWDAQADAFNDFVSRIQAGIRVQTP